tara:strand:- start:420 stop:1604 length:1185 start_codon:yes stop_codon:yes gene_type:complete
MPNVIRFKRRASGAAGAPSSLMETEPAYNAVDDTLYLGIGSGGAGGSASSIIPIGGAGAFVDKTAAQTISGNKTFTGTVDLSSATIPSFSVSQNLTVVGNLTVQGTTSTISSTTITVSDKNLELGKVSSPTDTTADGGGLTLKGTDDITFNWINATDSWTSSEHIELATNKVFRIDAVEVLSKTSLGSTVVGSSLTSVGTLTSGVWTASDIAIAHGGTGSSTASGARTNLGLVIGTDIEPHSDILTELATMVSGAASALADLTQAECQILDGATLTTTELNYVDGVTSAIQTQLNNKQPLDSELTELATMASGTASALADLTGTECQILDGATITTTELNIIDGGTSASSTTLATADRIVLNDNGTMKQVALTDLVTFLEDGATSGFDVNGGTY